MKRALLLVAVCALTGCGPTKPSPEQEQQAKEAQIKAVQQQSLSDHKDALFRAFYSEGQATAVTVNSAKITQWVGGFPSNQPDDVQQFQVDFTLYWKSAVHPDGYSEILFIYSHQPGSSHIDSYRILQSNGQTRAEVEEANEEQGLKLLEAIFTHL